MSEMSPSTEFMSLIERLSPPSEIQSAIEAFSQFLPTIIEKTLISRTVSLLPESRIDEQIVSQICGLSVSTIQKMRATIEGPPFEKHGRRCVYKYQDVLDWCASRRVRSTADAMAKGFSAPLRKLEIKTPLHLEKQHD